MSVRTEVISWGEHVRRPVLPFHPDHLIPTDSQTLAFWTRMAKPPVMLVPQATRAVAVKGEELIGLGGRGDRMPLLGVTMLSPPGVPLAMKATPSSQAGSADPPVSIVTASSHNLLGGEHLCPFSAHAQNPWRENHPSNSFCQCFPPSSSPGNRAL